MTSKYEGHTPGPWKLRAVTRGMDSNPVVRYWIDSEEGIPICDVKAHDRERTVADAALITDAPTILAERDELREALHLAYDLVAEAIGTQQYDFKARAMLCVVKCQSVLARLEGEGS